MALRIVTWLVSLAVHGGLALAMLLPASGRGAVHEGSGEDIMVVEQGIALEGFAKLGEDIATVEAVQAPPLITSAAQPLEQVEAVEEQEELPVEDVEVLEPVGDQIIASETGLEAELPEPVQEEIKEPKLEVKEQPLPPQMATVAQETVVAMRESSGEEKKGGGTTERLKYRGSLWSHIQPHKVVPRTGLTATAVVKFTVKSDGTLLDHKISKSSGSELLDNAALTSIAKAAPFPPIPSEWGEETYETTVPFKYSVAK